jgi:acyl-CoA thioesterase FadM
MSKCVVVCYDKELRAPFKVTPPVLDCFAYGRSLYIVHKVSVAALSWIRPARLVRDWLKSSSLVLQHECRNPHGRSICSHGEHRVQADLRKDQALRGNEP